MARFHRSKGFMLVERESYELAAAHLMYSLLYANSELALSEIMYIKMKCDEDYTNMTPDTAAEVLERAGELCGADKDTLGALYVLIKIAIDNEDVGTAIQATVNLYQLTGDEEIGNLARALINPDLPYVAWMDHDGDFSWNSNNYVHGPMARIKPRR